MPRITPWPFSVSLISAALFALPSPARADHALRRDGLALFNVAVIADNTTAARALRVFYKPDSFVYDFRRDSQRLLRGRQAFLELADYAVTSATISGKNEARNFMIARGWADFMPTPVPRVTAPTPTPTPIPTPTPTPTPGPDQVAPRYLPIDQRVLRQNQIFVKEKEDLVQRVKFGGPRGEALDEVQGREMRLKMLERQKKILLEEYPQDEALVKAGLAALDDQTSSVSSTGKFSWEY